MESRLRANLPMELSQELDAQLAELTPTAPNYAEQKFDLLRTFFLKLQGNGTDEDGVNFFSE